MNLRDELLMMFRCTCYAVAGFAGLVLVLVGIMWAARNFSSMPALEIIVTWMIPLVVFGALGWLMARRWLIENTPASAVPPIPCKVTYEEALRRVMCGEPERPKGWFRWLNQTKRAWYPPTVEFKLALEWRLIDRHTQDNPALLDAALLGEVRRHAWLIGKLGLRHIVHAVWPSLTPEERGTALAGLSEDYDSIPRKSKEDRAGDSAWIVNSLPDSSLSPAEVLEIACNAVYQEDEAMLSSVLMHGQSHRDQIVKRDDRLVRNHDSDIEKGQPRLAWAEDLAMVSDRVIDMVLEAAFFRCWEPGVLLALDYGADPNLHLWSLEDCQNEHFTSVSWLIAGERIHKGRAAEILARVIAHPKFKGGPTHSKALFYALINPWDDSWAWRLIGKGVTFESSTKPRWLERVPADQEYDWRKCSWRGVCERRASMDQTFELVGILPMLSCHEASWFDVCPCWLSTPRWETPITGLLSDVQLPRLKKFSAAGLPLRLTFVDYLHLVHARAEKTLEWLMEQWQTPQDQRTSAMEILLANTIAQGSGEM